jgi:hypothetical protein
MAPITSKNSSLYYEGEKIAKVINCNLDFSREVMENTTVEKFTKTFLPGIKSSSGSATILYDPFDLPTLDILNSIFAGSIPAVLFLNLDTTLIDKSISINMFVTQVILTVSLREAIATSVSFQGSGDITGAF